MTQGPGPFGSDFSELFDQHFGSGSPLMKKKEPEKGLPWKAKIIDDQYYVPLSQVVELLKQNDVLPAVRRGLENRIQLQAEFVERRKKQ